MKSFFVLLALCATAIGGYYYLSNRPDAPANPALLQEVQEAANQPATTTEAEASTTAKQNSPVPAMVQYTDPDLGFSFWYPGSWQVVAADGSDGDLHSYLQVVNQNNVEVFEITKNTTDQNTVGALATTTMGGLLVFQTSVQLSSGTTSEYLLPLTPNVSGAPSLLIRAKSDFNSLPLIETITSSSTAIAVPADAAAQASIIQAEKGSYIGL